jgi:superfamily II DNA or RNA helicase
MPDGTTNQPPENLTLRPHQQELVSQVLNVSPPARFLLSAPPGAGKAAALAAVAGALRAKNGLLRCLAIVPAPLSAMWQDQLMSFGALEAVVMTPQTYRRLQAETGGNINVWSKASSAVASIDFLKSAGRMDEVLAAGWDLVLLDEAHRSTDSTQRGEVAKKIWNAPNVAIAIATTQLPNQPAWLAEDAGTTKVHWKLTDLIGRKVMPERRIHTINYMPSDSERQIAGRIQELIVQNQQTQFVANLLLRRLNSSMYAFEQTLREILTVDKFAVVELHDWSSDDAEEEADHARATRSPGINRQAGEEILNILESEPNDSKWESCFQLLSSRGIGKTCSGILFTDYADTADYLQYLAKSRGLNVFLITGASNMEERHHALHAAQGTPSLLITTGAVEGVDFPFTNQIIHYDIPWNPRAMQQRIGRVERVGSKFEMFDHYYILEHDNAASEVLTRLIEELQAIEQEWK